MHRRRGDQGARRERRAVHLHHRRHAIPCSPTARRRTWSPGPGRSREYRSWHRLLDERGPRLRGPGSGCPLRRRQRLLRRRRGKPRPSRSSSRPPWRPRRTYPSSCSPKNELPPVNLELQKEARHGLPRDREIAGRGSPPRAIRCPPSRRWPPSGSRWAGPGQDLSAAPTRSPRWSPPARRSPARSAADPDAVGGVGAHAPHPAAALLCPALPCPNPVRILPYPTLFRPLFGGSVPLPRPDPLNRSPCPPPTRLRIELTTTIPAIVVRRRRAVLDRWPPSPCR